MRCKRNQRNSFSATGFHSHDDRSSFFNCSRCDHDSNRFARNRYSHSRGRYHARRESRLNHRRRSTSTTRDRYRTEDKHTGRRQYEDDLSQLEVNGDRRSGENRYRGAVEDDRHDGRGFDGKRSGDGAKVEEECAGRYSGHVNHRRRGFDNLGTELKRYVSFYFTNFPYQLSNFYLRKGFEVCGMLEDVFVPKKRNRRGQPFGFVKFSNVKDVNKLLSALNKVQFGNFCVRARVASFDRNNLTAGQRMESEWPVLTKGNERPASREGRKGEPRTRNFKGNGGGSESKGPPVENRVVKDVVSGRGGSGDPEAVRVGEVVIPLSARNELAVKKKDMRSYRTEPDDVAWAQNGLVATIINGEAVPVVQSRIMDAGFNDVILTPMGADKVFVRCSSGNDVKAIITMAKEFFRLIFSSWTCWDNHAQDYRRGAWVRLYGIPLQAWNENFFKLCVFDCGRLLRVDNGSLERERIDFARVLIATPTLEIVNTAVTVLVDGILNEVKIVEEWGFNLGEDKCLVGDDAVSVTSHSDHEEGQGDPEVSCHFDNMVENLAKGMNVEDDIESQENFEFSKSRGGVEGGSKNVGEAGACSTTRGEEHVDRSKGSVSVIGDSPISKGSQGSISICSPVNRSGYHAGIKGSDGSSPTSSNGKRAKSCPPGATRSMLSGPWSWECLNDLNQRDAGVVFSASKRSRKKDRIGEGLKKNGQEDPKRRKGGGVFRHTVSSLKKVARMPS
ncbi:putative sulfate transporter, partial [Trifolium pratense]